MVKIRLRRMGTKKRPFFRVVVADSRSPRDGRFIENIGRYQPMSDPSVIEIDEERALHWLGQGAQPSDPVRVLLERVGIWEQYRPGDALRVRQPKPAKPKTPPEPAVGEPAPTPPAAEEPAPTPPAAEEPAPPPPAAEEPAPPPPAAEEGSPEPSEPSAEETL